MFGFLASVLLPFGSTALNAILKSVDKRVSEQTERERIKGEIIRQHMQNRTDVLLKGVWVVWVAMAFPVVIYFNKLILWDKLIMGGTVATDPLTGLAAEWATLVLHAIFLVPLGGSAISRIGRMKR